MLDGKYCRYSKQKVMILLLHQAANVAEYDGVLRQPEFCANGLTLLGFVEAMQIHTSEMDTPSHIMTPILSK